MGKRICTLSSNAVLEYCSTICRVGKIVPLEDSDFLAKTTINGFDIIVRKDELKEGSIVVYTPIECALNSDFLAYNNLYSFSNRAMNRNADEVENLILSGNEDEAKRKCGFFEPNGRVRILKLRGNYSMGFIFMPKNIVDWTGGTESDLAWFEEHVDTTFDTVNDTLFVRTYIPSWTKKEHVKGTGIRSEKKFNRIVDFHFHYNTFQLNCHLYRFRPDDVITVTPKFHGTSAVFSNTPVKVPLVLSEFDKVMNKVFRHCRFESLKKNIRPTTAVAYGNVYSGRTRIKNEILQYHDGKYAPVEDNSVWGRVNALIKDYIPKGFTLYGEIVGRDKEKAIQKGYYYGCGPYECKLMVYRIHDDVNNLEYNIADVAAWTKKLLQAHPELKKDMITIPILYHGKVKDLYPDIDYNDRGWRDVFLATMKRDSEHFGMEEKEPYCDNSVYREGVVVRLDDDPMAEAFKLKCMKFLGDEAKRIDKGEVDIEMSANEDC